MSNRRHRKSRLPAEPVEIRIESLSHEARGIARIDGKVVFVSGALSGERVIATYVRRRSKLDELKTDIVLERSPQRVKPQCKVVDQCGGCSLQHMNSLAQIEFKESVLFEQMQHAAKIDPQQIEILPCLQAKAYHYRRKARLAVRIVAKKGGALVGFREKYSSFITNMNSCEVLVPEVAALLQPLKELITGMKVSHSIPQIEVAVGELAGNQVTPHTESEGVESGRQVALVFRHLQPMGLEDLASLKSFAETHALQLYLQPGGVDSVAKIYPEDGIERLQYFLQDFGLEMRFHPMDFTQVNAEINRLIVSKALDLLGLTKDDIVLDLFCGLGNFTLALATQCHSVVGIEGSAEMVSRGEENAALNGLANISFFAANLSNSIKATSWANQRYDKILLDPPRSGAIEIIQEVADLGAQRIVYISCNPSTLARDTACLVDAGYQLKSAGVMDMFPHTNHVESMAVFDRPKSAKKL